MRGRIQRSSSDGGADGGDRAAPAPGKRPLTASIQRKANDAGKDDAVVQLKGAVSAETGSRGDSPRDLMDFFMGPAPVQMKPQKGATDAASSEPADGTADVTTAFDSIAQQAGDALAALEQADHNTPDHAARDAIVAKYSAQILKNAALANRLVQQRSADQRTSFKSSADRAADRVHAVLTWIVNRTGNFQMRQRFEEAVAAVDRALASVGTESVTSRSTPALRGTESIEAIDEKAALDQAHRDLISTIRQLRDAKIHNGIEPFHDLAALEDNPDPTFLGELLKAILVASIGHIFGGFFEAFTKVLGRGATEASAAAFDESFRAAALERVKDVTIDSVQGIGGKAADDAFAESTKDQNTKTKARTYFVAGFKSAVSQEQTFHEQLISSEMASGMVTAASLRAEMAALQAMIAKVGDLYFQRASAGWASYLAQNTLGKSGKRDDYGRQASNMKDFLGEPLRADAPNGERAFGSDKAQVDGVLHLHLEIDADRRHGSKAQVRRKGKVTVEGVNEDLRKAILLEAEGHVGKVWLPKVVYVSMANNSFQAARLALDERNVLRDHTEWEYIQQHTQHVADRAYETPEAFASLIRRTELA